MPKLNSASRKDLPSKDFAGPDRSYPVEDKAHARNAKARASEAVNAGRMSKSEESKIDAKADRELRKSPQERAAKTKQRATQHADDNMGRYK